MQNCKQTADCKQIADAEIAKNMVNLANLYYWGKIGTFDEFILLSKCKQNVM